MAKEKDFAIRESFVLQLVSVHNIAQPTQQDGDEFSSNRKLMMMTLTDGRRLIPCIDDRGGMSIPTATPPGTKILLKSGSVRKGILLFDSDSLQVEHSFRFIKKHEWIQVLGGRVESLIEEWEFQQQFGKLRPQTGEEEAAPRFEHFDPRKPQRKMDLGTFSTFEVLSKSTQVQFNFPVSQMHVSV